MALPENWSERIALLVALIALVVTIAYGCTSVFQNDDFLQILAMRLESDPSALAQLYPGVVRPDSTGYFASTHIYWRDYFRPATRFLQGALWRAFGQSAFPFHLLNILLYLGAIALVYRLIRDFGFETKIAFWGAVIFAIHPTHGEPVVWIGGMGGLACAVCFFLSLLFILRFNRSGALRWLIAGMLTGSLALLFKEDAAAFPLVMLVLVWHDKPNRRRAVWSTVMMAVLVSLWMIWRASVGASVTPTALQLSGNPLTWMRNALFYLIQLLIPVRLIFRLTGDFTQYFRMREMLPITPHTLVYGIVVTILAAALLFALGRRWKRFPPALQVGMLLALTSITPVLTFMQSAYRLIFIPSAGVAMAVAGWAIGDNRRNLRRMILSAWIVIMSVALVEQAQSWQSAGLRSDMILDKAAEIRNAIPNDRATVFVDLPNRHFGAYLFTSGFREGLMLKTDLDFTEIYDPEHNTFDYRPIPANARWFRWTGQTFEECAPRTTPD